MPEQAQPIITLTTDYGTKDHYVAAMKASILEVNPEAKIVDVTHDIAPHDLLGAGFTLRCFFRYFPVRSIHVCVVDPGGGAGRQPIVVGTENFYFIGPDNGLFSFVYDEEEPTRVHAITESHYQRPDASATFHGRDVFAPAAAWISRGVDISNFGDPVEDYRRIDTPKAKKSGDRAIQGLVIHVDRFGNLVTCIHRRDINKMREAIGAEAPFRVKVGEHVISDVQKRYGGGAEGPIALIGSSEFLEIAVPRKSAARELGVKRGVAVQVEFQG